MSFPCARASALEVSSVWPALARCTSSVRCTDAQAAVAELNAASYALERELRHLIVNNRMRRQGVEYLNDLQHTIELAKEYQQEQAEKGEES